MGWWQQLKETLCKWLVPFQCHSHGGTAVRGMCDDRRNSASWKQLSNIKKKLEANINLEAERAEGIRKRQVVSPAKLKLLERTVHIPSRFFKKKKSHSYAIQIDLPWQLLAFPLLVQKIFMMDGFSFSSSFTSDAQSRMLSQHRDSMWS